MNNITNKSVWGYNPYHDIKKENERQIEEVNQDFINVEELTKKVEGISFKETFTEEEIGKLFKNKLKISLKKDKEKKIVKQHKNEKVIKIKKEPTTPPRIEPTEAEWKEILDVKKHYVERLREAKQQNQLNTTGSNFVLKRKLF